MLCLYMYVCVSKFVCACVCVFLCVDIQSGKHYSFITSVYDDPVGIFPRMQTGVEYQTVLIPGLYVFQNSCSNL